MLTNEKTIHSVIRGNAKVNEVISLHDSGIRVIPGSIAYTDIKISNLDLLEKVLCEIEGYDIVLVDTPAGFNSNVGEIMNVMDDIICITTPELSALTDCLRTIKLADEQGKNIIGVIVNKFRDDALDMTLESIENFLSQKVIGVIPYDNNVRNAVYLKQPVTYAYPNSRASESFKKVSHNLAGKKYIEFKISPPEIEHFSSVSHIIKKTFEAFGML